MWMIATCLPASCSNWFSRLMSAGAPGCQTPRYMPVGPGGASPTRGAGGPIPPGSAPGVPIAREPLPDPEPAAAVLAGVAGTALFAVFRALRCDPLLEQPA